jgi:hypothetical protein
MGESARAAAHATCALGLCGRARSVFAGERLALAAGGARPRLRVCRLCASGEVETHMIFRIRTRLLRLATRKNK